MKELNTSKTTMEEQYRSKIIEITSQCEIQMTTMRINNEQDMEKMRSMHSSLANEIRENYQEELKKIKENQEKYQVTTKDEASKDILRIREDCATR